MKTKYLIPLLVFASGCPGPETGESYEVTKITATPIKTPLLEYSEHPDWAVWHEDGAKADTTATSATGFDVWLTFWSNDKPLCVPQIPFEISAEHDNCLLGQWAYHESDFFDPNDKTTWPALDIKDRFAWDSNSLHKTHKFKGQAVLVLPELTENTAIVTNAWGNPSPGAIFDDGFLWVKIGENSGLIPSRFNKTGVFRVVCPYSPGPAETTCGYTIKRSYTKDWFGWAKDCFMAEGDPKITQTTQDTAQFIQNESELPTNPQEGPYLPSGSIILENGGDGIPLGELSYPRGYFVAAECIGLNGSLLEMKLRNTGELKYQYALYGHRLTDSNSVFAADGFYFESVVTADIDLSQEQFKSYSTLALPLKGPDLYKMYKIPCWVVQDGPRYKIRSAVIVPTWDGEEGLYASAIQLVGEGAIPRLVVRIPGSGYKVLAPQPVRYARPREHLAELFNLWGGYDFLWDYNCDGIVNFKDYAVAIAQ